MVRELNIAKKIALNAPKKFIRLVEPFGDGGTYALFLAKKKPKQHVLNIVDEVLFNNTTFVQAMSVAQKQEIKNLDWVSSEETFNSVLGISATEGVQLFYKFFYLKKFGIKSKTPEEPPTYDFLSLGETNKKIIFKIPLWKVGLKGVEIVSQDPFTLFSGGSDVFMVLTPKTPEDIEATETKIKSIGAQFFYGKKNKNNEALFSAVAQFKNLNISTFAQSSIMMATIEAWTNYESKMVPLESNPQLPTTPAKKFMDTKARGQAHRDLEEELVFERQLLVKIEKLNKSMVIELQRQVANGLVLDASEFGEQWQSLLFTHYSRVGATFSNRMIPSLPDDLAATDLEVEEILAALLVFYGSVSIKQADTITTSNQNNIDFAVQVAQDTQNEENIQGNFIGPVAVAAIAATALAVGLGGRSESIAMFETGLAVEAAKATEIDVLIGRDPSVLVGSPQVSPVKKEWVTRGDSLVRPSHRAADGQVVTTDKPFTVMGEQLRWPKDTSLGASSANVARCLHPSSIVDACDVKKLIRRYYKGLMFTIQLSNGDKTTVTPNHPVLTSSGWKFAKDINKFDNVVYSAFGNRGSGHAFNVQNMPPTIEEVFNSNFMVGHAVRVPGIDVNFHGEIPDHDVDIINVNGFLPSIGETLGFKLVADSFFPVSDYGQGLLFSNCLLNTSFCKKLRGFFSDGLVCGMGKFFSVFDRGQGHPVVHRFRSIPRFNTSDYKCLRNGFSLVAGFFKNSFNGKALGIQWANLTEYFFQFFRVVYSVHFGWPSNRPVFSNGRRDYFFVGRKSFAAGGDRVASSIIPVDVICVKSFHYAGPVYNLETKSGVYLADGIVNHNCRCASATSKDSVFAARSDRAALLESLQDQLDDVAPLTDAVLP